MGWGWKVAGVSLGAVMGGPVGAALGGLVGHALDGSVTGRPENTADATPKIKKEVCFIHAISCMLFRIAAADGRVSTEERSLIWDICLELNVAWEKILTNDEIQIAFSAAEKGLGGEGAFRGLAALAQKNEEFRQNLLRYAWRIAARDGGVCEAEMKDMIGLAKVFGSSPDEFSIISIPFYRAPKSDEKKREAAVLMGIPANSSPGEAQTVFRKHAQTYHPDKYASLPPEIRQLAAEKFIQIKKAFDDFLNAARPINFYGLVELSSREDNLRVICPHCGSSRKVRGLGRSLCGKCRQAYTVDEKSFPVLTTTGVSSARPGEIVVCFFCAQKNKLPDKPYFDTARCGKCHCLLLFEAELAEVLHGSE
jgi:DnaJ like chaperone protein